VKDDDLNRDLDRWLFEARPPRYIWEPDITWMDPIIDRVAKRLPETEVKKLFARQFVRRHESGKSRYSNNELRKIYDTRQWPFDWMERAMEPLSVDKERVQLGMCTAADFEIFAEHEEASANAEHSVRLHTVTATRYFSEQLRVQRVERFIDIHLPPL
jgi:hypothetical protein